MCHAMKDNPRSQKFYQNFCVERCASSHSIGATPQPTPVTPAIHEKGNKKHMYQQQHTINGSWTFSKKGKSCSSPTRKSTHTKKLWNLQTKVHAVEGNQDYTCTRRYHVFHLRSYSLDKTLSGTKSWKRINSTMCHAMKDNPRSQKFYQNFCVERCASSHSIGATPQPTPVTPAIHEKGNKKTYVSATAHDQWIVDFLKKGKIMQFTH